MWANYSLLAGFTKLAFQLARKQQAPINFAKTDLLFGVNLRCRLIMKCYIVFYYSTDFISTGVKTQNRFQTMKKSKLNLHYTRGIMPKRVTSGGAHLRGLAPGLHSSEETSQWWRAVGDTAPI